MCLLRVPVSGLFSLLLLAICLTSASAQKAKTASANQATSAAIDSLNPEPSLTLISQYADREVRLRWAASSASAWLQGNHFGYTVERLDLDAPETTEFVELAANIKPYDDAGWRKLDSEKVEGDYHLVAAEILLGGLLDQLVSNGPNIAAARQFEEYHHMALLVADLSWPTALGLGLAYADNSAVEGKRYLYRVRLSEQPSDMYIREGATSVLAKAADIEPPVLTNVREAERAVTLNWARILHESRFTAYTIERASLNQENWQPLNERPYVHGIEEKLPAGQQMIVYTDTLERNYQPHRYRVIGHTPFGKTSKPSEVVTAMGRDKTPPKAPLNVQVKTSPGPVATLSWEYDASALGEVAGFWVARNADAEGNFTELHKTMLPRNTRSFTDPSPDARGTNYYIVAAVDTAGNGAPSMAAYAMIIDSIPPARPRGLDGSADSTGIVTLTWAVSPEPDIIGYHVYFAHQKDHNFAILTGDPLQAHGFLDSIQIRSLKRDIFYYVVAVDATSNYSQPSDTLRVVKPDLVPPAPPVLSRLDMVEGVVVGQWRASSSSDVERYEWLRRASSDQAWTVIETWPGGDTSHILRDKTALAGKLYEYCIRAIDESGLVSDLPFILEIRGAFAEGEAVQDFRVSLAADQKSATLSWKPAPGQDLYIYRALEGANFDLIKRVDAQLGKWQDMRLRPNTKYEYAVQLRSATQLAGELSKAIEVVVK